MAKVARKPHTKKNHALDQHGFYVAADGAVRANKYTCDSCAQGLVLVRRRRVASRSAGAPDVQIFFRHFPDEAFACVDGYTPNGHPVDYYGAAVRAAQRDRRELVLGCSECDQDLPFPYVITDRNLNGFNQKYGEDLLKLALDRDGTYRMKVGVRCPWIETPRCPSCGALHAAEQVATAEAAEKERVADARDAQQREAARLRDAQEREAARLRDAAAEVQRNAAAEGQREAEREARRLKDAEAHRQREFEREAKQLRDAQDPATQLKDIFKRAAKRLRDTATRAQEQHAEQKRCAGEATARQPDDTQELARARGREWCSTLKKA